MENSFRKKIEKCIKYFIILYSLPDLFARKIVRSPEKDFPRSFDRGKQIR
jgi:hypothetical protein